MKFIFPNLIVTVKNFTLCITCGKSFSKLLTITSKNSINYIREENFISILFIENDSVNYDMKYESKCRSKYEGI